MKLDEATELAYPRKLVEQIILGLSNPLNRHLIKLVGFRFPPDLRRHFRREVKTWLSEIQSLRLKPNSRPGSFKFYFDLLYDYPFGGIETRNMQGIIDLIAGEYDGVRPIKQPAELVEWLRDFHSHLAERLHKGEDVLDLIPE
ncbi:MAG TPA: hypothetical protein VGR45_13180 [Stellaceae bacterium]|nr:hypothetical protein [Stellaceae bacterium]